MYVTMIDITEIIVISITVLIFVILFIGFVYITNGKNPEDQFYDLYKFLLKLIKSFINLKQHKMNYKALGRAMGFMFLPTLGVLTVLLVGFFDPVAMWNFIKSNDNWAIFIRVVLLIAEVTLIVIMYFIYNKEDLIKKALNSDNSDCIASRKVDSTSYICSLFNGKSSDNYVLHFTKNKNIVVVERKPKE